VLSCRKHCVARIPEVKQEEPQRPDMMTSRCQTVGDASAKNRLSMTSEESAVLTPECSIDPTVAKHVKVYLNRPATSLLPRRERCEASTPGVKDRMRGHHGATGYN